MTKKTETAVEKLEEELAEALRINEQYADESTATRRQYDEAVAAGDMEKAAELKAEANRLEDLARQYKDRIESLESQRTEAEKKDNSPAYKEAVKKAEDAIQEEKAAHDALAELAAKLESAYARVKAAGDSAAHAVHRAEDAAVAAHESVPDSLNRQNLAATGVPERIKGAGRDLINLATFEQTRIHNATQRRRQLASERDSAA